MESVVQTSPVEGAAVASADGCAEAQATETLRADEEKQKVGRDAGDGEPASRNEEEAGAVARARRTGGELIVIGNDENSNNNNNNNSNNSGQQSAGDNGLDKGDGGNLQEAFLKFRAERQRERRLQRLCRENKQSVERTPEFKAALRQKFVNKALEYIGVPYAEKYMEEGQSAPLYLDCCGLVRRVLQDLQEEFGFKIGRWNQAYQFDTLPVVIEDDAHLQRGDLIFYEGIYHSAKARQQKHNIVHVEIFLGDGETGEETVGARYQRGAIQVHSSYRFESKNYEIVAIHRRSLETWLDGQLISHCAEHEWKEKVVDYDAISGKRSIFAEEDLDLDVDAGLPDEDQQEEEEAQVRGHDVPGEMETGAEKASTCRSSSADETASEVPKTATDSPPRDGRNGRSRRLRSASNPDFHARTGAEGASAEEGKEESSARQRPKELTAEEKYRFFVGRSNGTRMVVDYLTDRRWVHLPQSYNFTTRYHLKWVERRSDIDYLAHRPGQIVNHIPNNDVITTKVNLLETLREYFASSTTDTTTTAAMLADTTTATGSAATADDSPADAAPDATDDRLFGAPDGAGVAIPFMPVSFRTDRPAECLRLFELNKRLKHASPTGDWSTFIYKPDIGNRGRGVELVRGQAELRQYCQGTLLRSSTHSHSRFTAPNARPRRSPVNASGSPLSASGCSPGGGGASSARSTPASATDPKSAKSTEEFFPPNDTAVTVVERSLSGVSPTTGTDGVGGSPLSGHPVAGAEDTDKKDAPESPMRCSAARQKEAPPGVIQRYIEQPLLANARKFDIRSYCLIACTEPHYVVYFHPGYVRVSLEEYDLSDPNNKFVHLTNASVQKKHPGFQDSGGDHIFSMAQLADLMRTAGGRADAADYIMAPPESETGLAYDMKKVMTTVFLASKEKLMRKHGFFDLLGFDFMVTDDLQLSLIEVNTNPALTRESGVLQELLPRVVSSTLDTVLSLHNAGERAPQQPKPSTRAADSDTTASTTTAPATTTTTEDAGTSTDADSTSATELQLLFHEASNFVHDHW